jgi:hypothetical protein
LAWYKNSERAPWEVECILLERALVAGKPALRIVGRLARYIEDRQHEPAEREAFWSAAQRKLGKLRRLTPRDRWQIETLLTARIPKPELGPSSATVRPAANPVTGPHQPLTLRTR